MRNSQIRWKKGDFITLGKAVSQFNKKINELQKDENLSYLPEMKNYQDIKENITTRRELQRVIKSLRRFKEEGAEDLYVTQAGEEITKWERRELGIQTRTAQTRLTKELKELYTPKEGQKYSRAQMGSIRVREIEAQLKNLKQIETKKGYEFKRLRQRIHNIGTSDYEFRKATVYRNNFMNELTNLKNNNKEFIKVYEYFEKIKNPIEFFNTTQKSQVLQDFFEWYMDSENYGNFQDNNELVEYIINEYK